MDYIIKTTAAMGVPGLVLLVAIELVGCSGGAAIMVALAAIGPGGALGGIATLGIILLISQGIAKYGFENIAKGVVIELYTQGKTEQEIRERIQKMPVSHTLKLKLYELLGRFPYQAVMN